MNAFMHGFMGELSKHASFKDVVHHPITQAMGYAALAGEGAHAMSEAGMFGTKAKRWSGRGRWGKRLGKGTLAGATAFLAAEGLASLTDVFSKKRKKKSGKPVGDIIIKVQPTEHRLPKIRVGKVPKLPMLNLSKITKSIGFKR